ncbi:MULTISPECIES: Ig-like domain-containing protein [Flavobacterium]|uniref:Ig-like domain-containing protein n=1 Tax=Flavobacterium hankyongi TaxID=1176532 RepID=A0ABP8ZNB1_9FLAO|nr:Ig-like domain-containing protein [Flavobacterium sp. N1846]
MKKINIQFFLFLTFVLIVSCAKRGTITGGEKDITPPKIISSNPKNLSTQFNTKTIKINFDEFIKVKDLQKNLIVSPPMKNQITVLPQGTASKQLVIKINDTLKANTTYSFNFGQSIVDNNEGNAYPQLKYVFSTGPDLDSLFVEGTIKDSYEKETDNYVNVMLFEVDENFKDSIIYKQNPRYITNTLDSLKTFKIENVKAGNYKLIALKEKTTNYKFDPNSDKIGFYNQTITVPDKSIFELELFKEDAAFKAKKPYQASGNRGVLGYEGKNKNIKLTAIHKGNPLPIKVTKFPERDSLQIWFPVIKNDSISLQLQNKEVKKDFVLKLKNQKQDTLSITAKQRGGLNFNETFTLKTSTPLEKFDFSKMSLTKKDSSKVDFKTNYDEFNHNLEILFTKDENERYTFKMLPNAIEDYLGQKNDSLNFTFTTKNYSDYGNLKLNFKNVKSFPIVIELTDSKGKILASQYSENNPVVEFLLLEPQRYSLRIIYDENKNKERDTGSYLEKRQPEEVVHYPTEIDVRANWDVNQDVDLGK